MYVSIDIPEIENYPEGFPGFWIRTIFIGQASSDYQVNALTTLYVRLVEAAFVEYRLGLSALKEYWNTHTSIAMGAMHRSCSYYESCITNMHRAQKCFSRMRRHPALGELSATLNSPKPSFVHANVSKQLRNMRNEIHHTEEMLMNGHISRGQPLMLRADGPETPHPTEANQTNKSIDRLIVGNHELLFSELADWLVEMGVYCEKISKTLPSSSEETNT